MNASMKLKAKIEKQYAENETHSSCKKSLDHGQFGRNVHELHEQLADQTLLFKSRNLWLPQSVTRLRFPSAILRQRPYLSLTLYLVCVIFLRLVYLSYFAHASWSGHQGLENYLILGLMLLFCCVGLQVAGGFLCLTAQLSKVKLLGEASSFIALAMLGWYLVIGDEQGVALVVFTCMFLFMLCMLVIGIVKARHGDASERIFLAAALCGMSGAGFSMLVLANVLPFISSTYLTLELLAFLEVSLLAFALGCQAQQQQQACIRAERMASRDSLTDLYNRRAFLEMARPIWSTAQRNQRPITMIMLDIDHFKQVNDQFGHEVGDKALMQTADLLANVCRAGDLLSRWGGEEFLLLLPETDLEQARVFAERIRLSLEALGLPIESDAIFLTASLGASEGARKKCLEEMIREADVQLYNAKRNGRNQTSCEKPEVAELRPVILCA
ncbi:MAG: diguanylate cyclase [Pseudomonadota bacterium]